MSTMDWDRAAIGWEKRADRIRQHGMPVSSWMVEQLQLQPGERVLELAAGPGDTGFLAAEQVLPGGTLICSDSSEAMLAVARARAEQQGITNVEFKQLSLEWIDLETASVDAALCRWGVMLIPDPATALREVRRVLAPGGRFTAAVWDLPDRNPWASIPAGAMVRAGHVPPPDPTGPGMFALAAPGRIESLLADAGFVEWSVEPVALDRVYESVDTWIAEQLDLSQMFSDTWGRLSEDERAALLATIREQTAPFTDGEGAVALPGSSLAVLAHA